MRAHTSPEGPYNFAVLTISDKGSEGLRQDTSGEALQQILSAQGFILAAYEIVPDKIEAIQKKLLSWADEDKIDLIVTTGGTGLSPTDQTPEATRPLLHKEIPGMAEAT